MRETYHIPKELVLREADEPPQDFFSLTLRDINDQESLSISSQLD